MVRLNTIIGGVAFVTCRGAVFRGAHDLVDDHESDGNLNSFVSAEVASTLETVSDALVDPDLSDRTNVAEAVNAASAQMDVESATKLVEQKQLTPDVSNLVAKARTATFGEFSEESLAKARRALNELVEKAWIELDDKIFKCKGFQEMNRENFGQVTRDIMRLIEQINDLERIEAEAIEGISGKEQEIMDSEALLAKETKLYNIEYAENKAELTIRQNDLDVFQFILVFTKCPDATSLAQTHLKVCETMSGRKTLFFSDKAASAQYHKLLTPSARNMIDNILRGVEHETHVNFLQQPANQSTTPQPKPAAPVKGAEGKECGGLDPCMTCGPDPPDCALLHDKLSLMWGEFKDKVDELTMEMMKNEYEFEELKENLNSQIRLLVKSKGRFQQLLAESRSNMAADRTEMKEKYKQKSSLNKQYYSYMRLCKKRIAWILGQDMCAIKTVRNAVLENSTECPSSKIQDCVMDAWVPGQCTVSCDDSCDPSQPFKCGGWQKMVRRPVATNDDCGIKCPLMEKYKRCGQFLCPLDCHMSSWSGWSKCTAECEGGLQSHTRSIRVKPRNGGEQCNTVEESRPCNTMSCDRNCRLARWTQWSPCSVACGGGMYEKQRHVLIPTRGEGKCPRSASRYRYRKGKCNTQACNGDEICVAVQDLVIAVDGSGSLQDSGFKILKEYVGTVLGRYETEYFGDAAVKLGIVLFGNGVIMPDGKTVSPAINAQKLTFNMDDVQSAVAGLPFKKGFTNMAQAFSMAEDMFVKGSRKSAQQSLMIVTDGKPSFSFMTNEMAEQLEDKSIMRYFVVVSDTPLTDDSMKNMLVWASQPWETNLIHVAGLNLLSADMEVFAEKAITKFCPQAYSPSTADYESEVYGFHYVKKEGYCGPEKMQKNKNNMLGTGVASAEACAYLASGAQRSSFLFGKSFKKGVCVGGQMAVDAAQYKLWESSKENPLCPTEWVESRFYDFFAMEPAAMKES